MLEPSGIFRNGCKQLDGMSLIPWTLGKPITAKETGAAATMPERKKIRKYSALQNQFFFVPVTV